MQKLILPNYQFSNADDVKRFITNLFQKKPDIIPRYHTGIHFPVDREYGKGIYFFSKNTDHHFMGFFTSRDLFPQYTLENEFFNEIAVVRNVKFPSSLQSDVKSIEANDCFSFGFIRKDGHIPVFHWGNEIGSPNFIMKELSIHRNDFVTFNSLLRESIQNSMNLSFQALATFYYELKLKHPNADLLGYFEN